ncbi:MAG: rhodanese-like domain-containing protein [archaeon]
MAEINIKKIFLIVTVSFGLGITYNYFSAKGISLSGFDIKKYISAELINSASGSAPLEGPKSISLKEALKLHEANVTFIDARDSEDFLRGHIENAISIPYNEFGKYKTKLSGIPKDEPLVSYCGGSDCELSIMLGSKLASMGYSKVFVFFGGWDSWTEAKYAISR